MRIENPRTDIVSHKTYEKHQLIRLVKSNKKILIDVNQNMPGRGCYILKDKETIKRSKKALTIALKTEISDEFIAELLNHA